jgi:hypothetical protein
LSWNWTVLLHSDAHTKPVTSISAVLLTFMTYLQAFSFAYFQLIMSGRNIHLQNNSKINSTQIWLTLFYVRRIFFQFTFNVTKVASTWMTRCVYNITVTLLAFTGHCYCQSLSRINPGLTVSVCDTLLCLTLLVCPLTCLARNERTARIKAQECSRQQNKADDIVMQTWSHKHEVGWGEGRHVGCSVSLTLMGIISWRGWAQHNC